MLTIHSGNEPSACFVGVMADAAIPLPDGGADDGNRTRLFSWEATPSFFGCGAVGCATNVPPVVVPLLRFGGYPSPTRAVSVERVKGGCRLVPARDRGRSESAVRWLEILPGVLIRGWSSRVFFCSSETTTLASASNGRLGFPSRHFADTVFSLTGQRCSNTMGFDTGVSRR